MYVTYIAFTFSKTIPNDTHWFSLPHFQTTYQGQISISCSCKAEFGPHSIILCIAQIFLTVKPCQNKKKGQLKLPTVKKTPFLVQFKQIFDPSYFVTALAAMETNKELFWLL